MSKLHAGAVLFFASWLVVLAVSLPLPAVRAAVWQATSIHTSGTLPVNCTVGNIYLKTGASAGFYICLATDTWTGPLAAGSGAPTDAEYWTGAADGTLSAEHDLSALATGLVINTAGTPSAYAGDGCAAGDFVTDVSASGVLTCDTPAGGSGGTAAVGIVIDGGGSTISTGFAGCTAVQYAGTIVGWAVTSQDSATPTSGSIQLDVWVDTTYIPTVADTVVASAPIVVSSATSATEDDVSTWTTALSGTVAVPEYVCFNVDSVTSLTKVVVQVFTTKS